MTVVCDFCKSKDVHWSYPARDFAHRDPILNLTFHSGGGWTACTLCHYLIEQDDYRGLAERSADTHPERGLVPRHFLIAQLRGLHESFRKARTGPPIPADKDTDLEPVWERP